MTESTGVSWTSSSVPVEQLEAALDFDRNALIQYAESLLEDRVERSKGDGAKHKTEHTKHPKHPKKPNPLIGSAVSLW